MPDLFLHFPATLWAVLILAALLVAGLIGHLIRAYGVLRDDDGKWDDTQEGYVVTAVTTMLAFVIGFTFALALDRFEDRRELVGEDARAIQEFYLKAQILEEPYRSTISGLVVQYVDNRIALGTLTSDERGTAAARNDQLVKEIWKATIPAFQSVRGIDFSSAFVDSANRVIEMDAARIAARNARIPSGVFVALFIYAFGTALVLGFVLKGRRSRTAGLTLLVLYVVLMALLVDLNQPATGIIRESQQPMQRLTQWLHANPPASFGSTQVPLRPVQQ